MTCTKCGTDYEMESGDNQHTGCPKCQKPAGDMKQRGDSTAHAEAMHRVEQFWDATPAQRKNMRRRRNYRDGRQWTATEKKILDGRNQPAVVYNYVGKKVDHLDGIEIETRTDPKPRPRTPMHEDDVQAAEDAIRYACDATKVQRVFSAGWHEKVVEGICGAIVEHEVTGAGDNRDIKLPVRYMHWDRIYYDPHSREPDFSDAKYKGCFTYMDASDAKAFYSKRNDKAKDYAEMIDSAPVNTRGASGDTGDDKPLSWSDPKRKRVMVCEEYYQEADEKGDLCWYTRHFTSAGFVVPPKKTGYVDEDGVDVCPLELDSAFVDGDGDTHERYGLVERMMWPQDEINKRRSKAMFAFSVRQTTAEEGAILDVDKFKNESAKPDGVKIVQKGAMQNGRIKEEMAMDIAQGHVQLLAEAKDAINQIGPDLPMIATAAASSGRERQIMQNVGMTELAKLRDQHSDWKHRIVTQLWWRIRQFWTYEMWKRVQDDTEETGYRFVGLNRRTTKGARIAELMKNGASAAQALGAVKAPPELLAEAMKAIAAQMQQNPAVMQQVQANPEQAQKEIEGMAMQQILQGPFGAEPFTAADVAKLCMDIVLDEAPDVAIIQQEEAEGITKIGETMIAAGQPFPLELAIEVSSLRGDKKKKLAAIIEKGRQPDPAVAQMQQQMQELQASMAQVQLALTQAQVAKTESEAQLNQAKVEQVGADIQVKHAQAIGHAVEAGSRAGQGGMAGVS
jgi:hypothetical protein